MKPTLEELTEYLLESTKGKLNEEYTKTLAKAIHESFNPPMKPLSELHKDEKACREIFQFVFPDNEFEKEILIERKLETRTVITGAVKGLPVTFELAIQDQGQVYPKMVETRIYRSVFSLADKIRSLGYDVK